MLPSGGFDAPLGELSTGAGYRTKVKVQSVKVFSVWLSMG